MIQGLLIGAQVGRRWLGPHWRIARARLLARWTPSAARSPLVVATADASEALRRLAEETGSIVERALARRIEPLEVGAGSRAVRLRAATVAHVAVAGWRVGMSAGEAATLAAAGPLREVDARLAEALARNRDVADAPDTPAFQRRLALLEVVSDAEHPGLRSEHELDRLRRARAAGEVARRKVAAACIAQLERDLATVTHESPGAAAIAADAPRLLRAQWTRLERALLTSDELCDRAEELAGAYRRLLLGQRPRPISPGGPPFAVRPPQRHWNRDAGLNRGTVTCQD